ncbi:unnamed protein product [Periconia digitata]|uniref:Uncharacterized protein n=1 Tax=Periconia digitata TaxID=1303443 RepID=A0A9W4XYF3_9PLEO|nr:unnamed protein product [Periconia digitata]
MPPFVMSIKSEPTVSPSSSFTRELSADSSGLSDPPSDMKTEESPATSHMEQPAISQGGRQRLKRRASTSEGSISKKMRALMDEVDEMELKDNNHEEERKAWFKSKAELKSRIQTQNRLFGATRLSLRAELAENSKLKKEIEVLKKKLISREKHLERYGRIKKLIEEDLAEEKTSH